MRLLGFIFAIWILALNFLPCADSFAISGEKAKTELTTQHQGDDHNDTCSPFCHCACCAGFSINHAISSLSSSPLIASKNFYSYLPDNLIEISLPIWQPPKL